MTLLLKPMSSALRKKIVGFLKNLGQNVKVEDNIVAGRHNDYAPHNIITNGEGLSVLDFTMFDYDSVYYDCSNFGRKLEWMKTSPFYSFKNNI